jgi:hypothetical protein
MVFARPLDGAGIRYMATGSVAAMLYGEPRLTNDIDMVLVLPRLALSPFVSLFPLAEFYCPPVEVLGVECGRARRGHFNLLHHETGFKADVYLAGDDPLHEWGLARRRCIELSGGEGSLWVAPPEYVILRKLQYYEEGRSEKHILDIRGMLELSSDAMDMPELERWIRELSLQTVWKQVKE